MASILASPFCFKTLVRDEREGADAHNQATFDWTPYL